MRSFIRYLKSTITSSLVGVEIGVKLGENAEDIINNLNIEKLFLVDPWMAYSKPSIQEEICGYGKQEVMDKWYNEVYKKFRSNTRVSILKHTSKDASTIITDKVDFVYIDAVHTYDGVLEDCKLWYPLVKSNGILCGHDYNNEECGSDIRKAVNTFVSEYPKDIFRQLDCDWIIQKC
jgi:hypothetical protein